MNMLNEIHIQYLKASKSGIRIRLLRGQTMPM